MKTRTSIARARQPWGTRRADLVALAREAMSLVVAAGVSVVGSSILALGRRPEGLLRDATYVVAALLVLMIGFQLSLHVIGAAQRRSANSEIAQRRTEIQTAYRDALMRSSLNPAAPPRG